MEIRLQRVHENCAEAFVHKYLNKPGPKSTKALLDPQQAYADEIS